VRRIRRISPELQEMGAIPCLLLSNPTRESVPLIVAGNPSQPLSPEGIRSVRFPQLPPANAMRSQTDDEAKAARILSAIGNAAGRFQHTDFSMTDERITSRLHVTRAKLRPYEFLAGERRGDTLCTGNFPNPGVLSNNPTG
jgi:hypothetical protein